jgi:3'-phosphoadenosine 5'-phosphosulfate sulfotransferase (PAPS reductase)/FAD synthetase
MGRPVFLSFSAGKDSLAVLKLCEPYAGRFKLIWANTGYTFPHVEGRVRVDGERFGLVEVRADLKGQWEANGWPTDVASVDSTLSRDNDIRLQPWPVCCYQMKVLPILHYVSGLGMPVVLLHGQKVTDGWRTRSAPSHGAIEVVSPIADWSTEQVYTFLKDENVSLPAHYAEVKDSLDCWICPAHWTMAHAPEYGRYLAREYPEAAKAVRPVAEKIHNHLAQAVAGMADALAATDALSMQEPSRAAK